MSSDTRTPQERAYDNLMSGRVYFPQAAEQPDDDDPTQDLPLDEDEEYFLAVLTRLGRI